MSLPEFQRILCDLMASPALCRAIRVDAAPVLEQYDLSERERNRVVVMAQQRGMATNCALYRANRLTPIYMVLPLTCFLLGPDLRATVDHFWNYYQKTNLQYRNEVDRFAYFLRDQIAQGEVSNVFIGDILAFELAISQLEFLPRRAMNDQLDQAPSPNLDAPLRLHPLVKVILFHHEPLPLLDTLAKMQLPDSDLTTGDFGVLLDARHEQLQIKQIDAGLGRFLMHLADRGAYISASDEARAMLQSGLLVCEQGSEGYGQSRVTSQVALRI